MTLTKLFTTAIVGVVLATPTCAFFKVCYYSDESCATFMECLPFEEGFTKSEVYGADDDGIIAKFNTFTSCVDYVAKANADNDDSTVYTIAMFEETCRRETVNRKSTNLVPQTTDAYHSYKFLCSFEPSTSLMDAPHTTAEKVSDGGIRASISNLNEHVPTAANQSSSQTNGTVILFAVFIVAALIVLVCS